MRKLAVLTFVTLDGVMQGVRSPEEDPSDGFIRGGWANPWWDEVMEQVREEAMAEPYDLLLGRRTYDMFASGPNAGPMESATKYVATSHAENLRWANSTALTGDVAAEVARLKQEDGRLLQVHGSWALIQTLLAHDLVDEFRLWTFPVVVGPGKRLFGDDAGVRRLKMVKSRTTENGVVMGIYR